MKCGYCNGTGEHINDANRMTTCEFCGGTGEVEVVGDSVTDVCDKCGGTGEIEVTNEEWLERLTTEEKAKWFCDHITCSDCRFNKDCFNEDMGHGLWQKWLLEEHS